jgi:hypothetical protein
MTHFWRMSLLTAICLSATGCGDGPVKPQPQTTSSQRDDPSLVSEDFLPEPRDPEPLATPSARPDESESAVESATPEATAGGTPEDKDSKAERMRSLIRDLAKIEDPTLGLSPTMSGEGFAPIPWARHMLGGILMNHGLKDTDAFTALVAEGPAALPYLLESLDDKTSTQLTIEHSGGMGGMWFGERPAIRWIARDAGWIQRLVEQNTDDEKIAETVDEPREFIELAKKEKFPYFLPQAEREFNPRNAAERKVLNEARPEFIAMKGQAKGFSGFDNVLHEYTVTVGDVCYVIIGQITNRTYLAAQYQMTACVYIHSPTHDPRVAEDVRRVWTSDNPTEMLLASLKTDLEFNDEGSSYRQGAVLRLGYYFPDESEALLLELLDKMESPAPPPDESEQVASYGDLELLQAIVASKSPAVQDRTFAMMKATKDVHRFLVLSRAYGGEHDALVLQRTLEFIESLPETDGYDGTGIALLRMLGDRFPVEARRIYEQFIKSESTHRRDTVINALWYSDLAPELLPPLLDDKRPLNYSNHARVCDRAAQAISNNGKNLSFRGDSAEESRDKQIQKIKTECIGIGVRKTGGER